MKRPIILNQAIFSLCLAAILALPACKVAHAQDIVVISNPDVTISADEVGDIYTGERQFAGNIRLVPVNNAMLHEGFLSGILKMDAVQYNRIWTSKLFRDGIPQPALKSGDSEVIAYVKRTPGAIGYVSTTPPGVKIIYSIKCHTASAC